MRKILSDDRSRNKRELEWKDMSPISIFREILRSRDKRHAQADFLVVLSASFFFFLRWVSFALNFQHSHSDAYCNSTDKFSNSLIFIYSKIEYFSIKLQVWRHLTKSLHYYYSYVWLPSNLWYDMYLFYLHLGFQSPQRYFDMSWYLGRHLSDFSRELHLITLIILQLTHDCWPSSNNLHKSALIGFWMLSLGLT